MNSARNYLNLTKINIRFMVRSVKKIHPFISKTGS